MFGFRFDFSTSYAGPAYHPAPYSAPGTLAPPSVTWGSPPADLTRLLGQLLQSLTQLAAGWASLAGPPPQPAGLLPPAPSDPNDYASYLQAQRLGGTLEGKTGIAQRDAIPGSRFGQVQNPEGWQASVARNYAYQFAAYAVGADALTVQGLQAGQRALPQMSPDAQLFTQVASVFKGNLLGGPGFYDNPRLKQLLLSRGLSQFAERPGVGETDVQSIGAITQALNSGALTLSDVINSGAIDNMDRYRQVIAYVQQGQFNQALNFYDSVPI